MAGPPSSHAAKRKARAVRAAALLVFAVAAVRGAPAGRHCLAEPAAAPRRPPAPPALRVAPAHRGPEPANQQGPPPKLRARRLVTMRLQAACWSWGLDWWGGPAAGRPGGRSLSLRDQVIAGQRRVEWLHVPKTGARGGAQARQRGGGARPARCLRVGLPGNDCRPPPSKGEAAAAAATQARGWATRCCSGPAPSWSARRTCAWRRCAACRPAARRGSAASRQRGPTGSWATTSAWWVLPSLFPLHPPPPPPPPGPA